MRARRQSWLKRLSPPSWRTVLVYGAVLAGGIALMQWIEYQQLVRSQPGTLRNGMLAALFLGLGVWVGAQLFRSGARDRGVAKDGNPKAQAALGISEREIEVLQLLADGQSNKEIARTLGVSPNTVKTHIARLFEKLDVQRRTQAAMRARELGLVR